MAKLQPSVPTVPSAVIETVIAPAKAVIVAPGMTAPPDQVADEKLELAVWVSPTFASVNDSEPDTTSVNARGKFVTPGCSAPTCGPASAAITGARLRTSIWLNVPSSKRNHSMLESVSVPSLAGTLIGDRNRAAR